jgi:hypothetical protein
MCHSHDHLPPFHFVEIVDWFQIVGCCLLAEEPDRFDTSIIDDPYFVSDDLIQPMLRDL